MSRVRVLFAGTPEVAVPSLDLLLADERFEVVAVLTNPDRPRGRSSRPVPTPVAVRAEAAGIPLLRPERVAHAVPEIAASGAQIGAVVAYGSILPSEVLAALPDGFVNLHFSLLPRWRGAAPVQYAIRAGDAETGVTAFRLDEGMDTGPVLRRHPLTPPDDIDAGDLLEVLAVRGAHVLLDALIGACAGEAGTPQSDDGVTYAPRIGPLDTEIDWHRTSQDVARHVRSLTPRPGAFTTMSGERMKVAGAKVGPDRREDVPPGTVLGLDSEAILVACGTGTVRLERVQLAGRPWTRAVDQVRGRRITAGTVLGGEVTGS